MLTVPEPLPDDPEAVATALETAEIFGKQGDLKEAVRWVRRAAEIASDEGSDARALTLARAVADLNVSASQPPKPPPPPPLPEGASAEPVAANSAAAPAAAADAPPPPAASTSPVASPTPIAPPGDVAADEDPDDDAQTRVVDSAPMMAALAAEDLPPPPPVPTNGAHAESAADAPPRSTAPTTPDSKEVSEEPTPVSRSGIGSIAELLARKQAELPASQPPAGVPDESGWEESELPPPPPPVERRTARPLGERVQTPLIPSHPHLERPPLDAPVHQAVRASIVATAEPGVYVMRVLTQGQAPAPTAQEVFVVVTDAGIKPFGEK